MVGVFDRPKTMALQWGRDVRGDRMECDICGRGVGSRAWGGSVLAVSAARDARYAGKNAVGPTLVRGVFAGPHHPGRENEDESDRVQALAPESI
jgi:hypothetical protein